MRQLHNFQPAGVEFPFQLSSYLMKDVEPLYAYNPKDRVLARNFTRSDKVKKAQALRFHQIVEVWRETFAMCGNKATSNMLAKIVQYELRSVSKSLENVMGKTTFVSRHMPSKQEIIDFNIPYNNRMGMRIWTWNPNGKILTEDELNGYD